LSLITYNDKNSPVWIVRCREGLWADERGRGTNAGLFFCINLAEGRRETLRPIP
jgi:hypothetical protein